MVQNLLETIPSLNSLVNILKWTRPYPFGKHSQMHSQGFHHPAGEWPNPMLLFWTANTCCCCLCVFCVSIIFICCVRSLRTCTKTDIRRTYNGHTTGHHTDTYGHHTDTVRTRTDTYGHNNGRTSGHHTDIIRKSYEKNGHNKSPPRHIGRILATAWSFGQSASSSV